MLGKNDFTHVHPTVRHSFSKNMQQLMCAGVIDISLYDPKFCVSFLMIAKYLARIVFANRDAVTSNHAVLMMMGKAGAGKSILTAVLQKFLNGYKWIHGNFQSESILSASTIIIEEVELDKLKLPLYK